MKNSEQVQIFWTSPNIQNKSKYAEQAQISRTSPNIQNKSKYSEQAQISSESLPNIQIFTIRPKLRKNAQWTPWVAKKP